MVNKLTRMDVVREAREWLGTPFKHQGALKGVACDCIGLIKAIGIQHGLVDYDPNSEEALSYANYSMMPDSKRMREALGRWFIPVPVTEAQIADFLFHGVGARAAACRAHHRPRHHSQLFRRGQGRGTQSG
jgi:NlpC/P60 family putative phage cell wall peptidase